MSRFVSTRAGIQIGRAYVAPPRHLSGDEELVQRALLQRRRRLSATDLCGWLVLLGLAAATGVLIALMR